MKREKITLGGRAFVPVTETTVEHDLHFQGIVGREGLSFSKGSEESAEDFAARILDETVRSGKTLELLGCLVVPQDVGVEGWTPAVAVETAAFIAQLRGEKDKATVRGLILSLLLDFFRCGLASMSTSPSASKGQPAEPTNEHPTATAAGAAS